MTNRELAEQVEDNDYYPSEDPEFHDQALSICQDIGIPEDEAELLIEDY